MGNNAWSQPVSPEVAHRRVGGRRHYNAIRQVRAELRRARLVELLVEGGLERGQLARYAKELGVSKGTVSKDMARIFGRGQVEVCPYCGQAIIRASITSGKRKSPNRKARESAERS